FGAQFIPSLSRGACAQGDKREVGGAGSERAETRIMARVPSVDAVMLEARATVLTKRSIKKSSKLAGIDISIACMDLTTLEGKDSPGKVRSVCARDRKS